jgi:ParB family chromosome partitioning protein
VVRKALGRGLEALIPQGVEEEVPIIPEARPMEPRHGDIQHVALSKIQRNPSQPRTQFRPELIRELAASIRERGVLQPVLLRPMGDAYQIVAGERRFLAAGEAGFTTIPAIVRPLTDREALLIALIENLQRENLNPMDEARAYYRLATEYSLPHEEIGQRVGKDRSTVSNILRFNNLPSEIQASLESGSISSGHARALLGLPTPKAQVDLAKAVALMALEDDLMRAVGARVRVTRRRGGAGSIAIEYHTEEDLDRLVALLRTLEGVGV